MDNRFYNAVANAAFSWFDSILDRQYAFVRSTAEITKQDFDQIAIGSPYHQLLRDCLLDNNNGTQGSRHDNIRGTTLSNNLCSHYRFWHSQQDPADANSVAEAAMACTVFDMTLHHIIKIDRKNFVFDHFDANEWDTFYRFGLRCADSALARNRILDTRISQLVGITNDYPLARQGLEGVVAVPTNLSADLVSHVQAELEINDLQQDTQRRIKLIRTRIQPPAAPAPPS